MKTNLTVLCIVLFAVAILPTTTLAKDKPQEARTWAYAQVTGLISPHWALSVMPGIRYEFWDSESPAGKTVMYELFAGPVFIQKWDGLTLKVPLWYYYMGFPISKPAARDDYFDSHNMELIPTVEYKFGRWVFTSRAILHNKIYARNAVFKSESQRLGYSLLWRQLLQANYALTPVVELTLADEVFIGLVEDGQTNGLVKGEPFFEKHGLSMNRVYAGVKLNLPDGFSLAPQYIFETSHDPDKEVEVTKVTHYLYMVLQYNLKL